ncbi:ATP-binding protein [Streptomyces sp. NPDC056500]|uniref:ATP-binding protein n=1 Tax=Streptomyces sp. NPDC056500 TaxID=3345840 RepID=UPI0036769304
MPLAVVQSDAPTTHHIGQLTIGQSDIELGFQVSVCRTGRVGEPMSVQDRTWAGLMRRIGLVHLRIWQWEVLADRVDLLLSELVTNGFQHGQGETVDVRLWRTGGHVGIEVASGGGPQVPCPRVPGLFDESGRGLGLVAAVADAWGIADGGRIWCLVARGEST